MPQVPINAIDYDSFEDVGGADAYLAADVFRAAGWATRTEDQKGQGLVSATRILLGLPWIDAAPDIDAAPQIVQDITAMLAADVLTNPKLFADPTGNSNVKSAKAGSAAVEFFRPVEGRPGIPLSFWNMLVAAGLVGPIPSPDATDGALVSGISCGRRPLYGRPAWDYPLAAEDCD